jgi:hypothetical protein
LLRVAAQRDALPLLRVASLCLCWAQQRYAKPSPCIALHRHCLDVHRGASPLLCCAVRCLALPLLSGALPRFAIA